MSEWKPSWATHPGEHLAEYLGLKGWTPGYFAATYGIPYDRVCDILDGRTGVFTDEADILEAAFGLKAYIWMGFQRDFDQHNATQSQVSP